MKFSFLLIPMCVLCFQTAQGTEYIIKMKSNAGSNKSFNVIQAAGGVVKSVIPELNMVVAKIDDARLHSLPKSLNNEIAYIEKNGKVYATGFFNQKKQGSNATMLEIYNLWGMKAIKAPEAWAITTGSKDVILAVSDTGMWPHDDLNANRWHNAGEMGADPKCGSFVTSTKKPKCLDKSNNGIDDDVNGFIDDWQGWNFASNNNNPLDDHYHGTHVSGTIGATKNDGGVVGVNWNVSIMPVKFIGSDGSGDDDAAVKTILYAANMGAKAINCSWGGGDYSQAIYDAIEYAKSKGTLVIVAAGNDGMNTDITPNYPSSQDNENMIRVASVPMAGKQGYELSDFSNFGVKTVDVAAPGERIYSTYNPMYSQTDRVWYEYLDGTSMAAPHVTGVVGLVYAANPKLNWKQVKDIILSTTAAQSRLQGKILTGGILNAEDAVKKAVATK